MAFRLRQADASTHYESHVEPGLYSDPTVSAEVGLEQFGAPSLTPGPSVVVGGSGTPGLVLYDLRVFPTALSDAGMLQVYRTLRTTYAVMPRPSSVSPSSSQLSGSGMSASSWST